MNTDCAASKAEELRKTFVKNGSAALPCLRLSCKGTTDASLEKWRRRVVCCDLNNTANMPKP